MDIKNIKTNSNIQLTHKIIAETILLSFPLYKQCYWDQSCYYSPKNTDKAVNRCFIGLDFNWPWLLEQNLNENDFIIIHHPLKLEKILLSNDQLIINELYKKNVSLLCLHTNYDNHPKGMNYYYGQNFSYKNIEILNNGCAIITLKKPTIFKDILNNISNNQYSPLITYVSSNEDQIIQKIAVLLGSGACLIEELCHFPDIDLYITGDIKWHSWLLSLKLNIKIIDVHHQMESIFLNYFSKYLINKMGFKNKIVFIKKPLKLNFILNEIIS